MKKLNADDLFNIANGATFLASGGGGSIKTAYAFISDILQANKEVELAQVSELGAKDLGCVVGAMGSPESFDKIGLNGAEARAVDVINDNISGELNFTIPVETGSNLFVAMLAATKCFSPAVMADGDGAGRSVPTLNCLSYSHVINATPFALLNSAHGEVGGGDTEGNIVLNLKNTGAAEQAQIVEKLARPVLSTKGSFDGIAAIAGWHMTGKEANQALMPGTISRAMTLGQVIASAAEDSEVIDKLSDYLSLNTDNKAYNLSASNDPFVLRKVERFSQGGFDFNRLYFSQGEVNLIVINQNENLLVWDTRYPNPITICPDLICMLGHLDNRKQVSILKKMEGVDDITLNKAKNALRGMHGLSVEDVVDGQEVYLFGITSSNKDMTYIETFNQLAQNFGYFGPYKPVSELLMSGVRDNG